MTFGIKKLFDIFDSDNCGQDDKRKNCEALRRSILATCDSLTGRARDRCLYAAQDAYELCMSQD